MRNNQRLAANRASAAKSPGPVAEGKSLSSHTALKLGLTGSTVLLPTDEAAAFKIHLESLNRRYEPRTDDERLHVQTLSHIEWRLLRIPILEAELQSLGRKRFAGCHAEEPAEVQAILIEAEVLIEFQKPLANLANQESRLRREHERETQKLQELQSIRRARELSQLEEPITLLLQ